MTRNDDYLDEAIVLMVAPWLAGRNRASRPTRASESKNIAVAAKPEEA